MGPYAGESSWQASSTLSSTTTNGYNAYNDDQRKRKEVRFSFHPSSPAPSFANYSPLENTCFPPSPSPRFTSEYHPPPPLNPTSAPQVEEPFRESFVCDNYLNMLARPPVRTSAGGDFELTTDLPVHGGQQEDISVLDYSYGQWRNEDDGYGPRYLTSPHVVPFELDDCGTSPSPSSIDTPLLATPSSKDMEGIGMVFQDELNGMPLFGGIESTSVGKYATAAPKLPPADQMWTFSPSSPALDAFEPVVPRSGGVIPPPPISATRKRKNATPPAVDKKRSRSVAFGDDDDDDDEEDRIPPPPPTASQAEMIAYKRQMNTIAARRSRQRKREHLEALQEKVRTLRAEGDMWQQRALLVQEVLRKKGIDLPFDDEE